MRLRAMNALVGSEAVSSDGLGVVLHPVNAPVVHRAESFWCLCLSGANRSG